MDYTIRKASLDDREAIERLIAESARGLSQGDYSGEQIEAAIATVFGVDTDLIVEIEHDATVYGDEAKFGGGTDVKSAGSDNPNILSRIASISISC